MNTVPGPSSTPDRLEAPGPETSLVERFRHVASVRGAALAATSLGESYSYAELDDTSDNAARQIAAASTSPDQPIALLTPQSALALVGLVAIIKTGRPLVLLDPMSPHDRLLQIVERSGAQLLIHGQAGSSATERGSFGVPTLDLRDIVATRAADVALPSPQRDDVACIIYTSGSTGGPKGVAFTHGALLNEAAGGPAHLGIESSDRCALVMPLAFMAGFTVSLFALMNGSSLHAFDPREHGGRELPSWIESNGLTTLHMTPSLLRSLLGVMEPDQVLTSVRLVTTCGEPVYGSDVSELRNHLTDAAAFVSWSGASEVGQLSFYEIAATDPIPDGVVPVGRPAIHKHVDIVDAEGPLLPAGEIGEVVVRSRYLAAGYWRDPETTAEKFTQLADGETAYRMGDLGRFDADGTLHLLGRIGAAVKIRGYLVDPSEVEATLLAAHGVAEAVAVVTESDAGTAILNAYVAPKPGGRTASSSDLRRLAAEKLPSWMVPSNIVVLPELPRNERGKVDREALPPPPLRVAGRAPGTQWEVAVADLWREILKVDEIGVDDDFLQLGGDSLAVVEMLAAVEERFGTVLTSTQFATMSTVGELAACIAAPKLQGKRNDTVAVLRGDGSEPPLFCIPGAGDLAVGFMPLTLRLDRSIPVYGIQQVGLEAAHQPGWTIQAVSRTVYDTIREIRPKGPYHLLGHSMGGLVALEVAHMLRRAGEEVPVLIVVDSYLRGRTRVVRRKQPGSQLERVTRAVPARIREMMPTIVNRKTLPKLAVRLPVVGFVRFENSIQWDLFALQGWCMTQMYRAQPWDGPALYFSGRDNRHRENWKPLLTGPNKFVDIDSDHWSMILEPHVPSMAREINQWLLSDSDSPV